MDLNNQAGAPQGQNQQRVQLGYDVNHGGHYGACAALANQGCATSPEPFTGAWANVNQGLSGNYKNILSTYWQHVIHRLETENHDYKLHQLPLARIKKVMKADPDVKMISAEAPILFAKGCDIFITELTMRAWIHAEENKRRTLQRSDIASALSKSDMFDFLIDIVPREEAAADRPKRAIPGQIPQSNPIVQQIPHTVAPPSNYMGHIAGTGQETFGQRDGVYPAQAPPGSGSGFAGSSGQIYGEMDGIYGYPPLQSQQQVLYQVPSPQKQQQQQQQQQQPQPQQQQQQQQQQPQSQSQQQQSQSQPQQQQQQQHQSRQNSSSKHDQPVVNVEPHTSGSHAYSSRDSNEVDAEIREKLNEWSNHGVRHELKVPYEGSYQNGIAERKTQQVESGIRSS
ncbi:hypothetical protein K3495_g1201 [Podosphaera aphanis]|nr:hypothetical protein K3495_g1201 [Podosphaera aphanis]